MNKRQTNWEEYLPIAEFEYNSAKHSSTGYSPFMLMYGFQPRAPHAVGLHKEKVQAAKDFLEDMNSMLKFAQENIRKAQDRARAYADPHRRNISFEEGELVYLKVPKQSESMKSGRSPKLSPRYYGPFTILKRVGERAYKLQLPASSKVHPVFHVSRIKKKLGEIDNLVSRDEIEELFNEQSLPHEPERVLNVRNRRTRNTTYQECLVKWKDSSEESST